MQAETNGKPMIEEELCEAKSAKLRFTLTEYIFQPLVTLSTRLAGGTKLQGLQVLENSLILTK